MSISLRAKVIMVVGVYVALCVAAGIAYGVLAAVAVACVLIGPAFVGVVCSLPDHVDEITHLQPSLQPAAPN